MAGTKQPAEAMGFVQPVFFSNFLSQKKDKMNESVGERSASGEAMTEV